MKIKKVINVLLFLFFSIHGQETHKKDPHECKKEHNKKFTLCVVALPDEEQKQLLKELTKDERKEFFTSLSIREYDAWLDNYNEYDWARLYNSLTSEEQSHWPQTVAEQRIAIVLIVAEVITAQARYELVARSIDIIPFAKKIRQKIEECFDVSMQEKVEIKFEAYKKEKFNV